MATKVILAAVFILSASAALAGRCDTGKAAKDAGSTHGRQYGAECSGDYAYRCASAHRYGEPCGR
jgi:hypothetical protein